MSCAGANHRSVIRRRQSGGSTHEPTWPTVRVRVRAISLAISLRRCASHKYSMSRGHVLGRLLLFCAATSVIAVELAFSNLTFSVADGAKTILHGVGGTAASGRMLSIMGPSGSGKTTLLNALAGNLKGGRHARPHPNA